MKPITLVTGNVHKVKYFKQYCSYPVDHIDLDLTEIQSLDVKKIVEHKAKEAFKKVQKSVVVEDVSLTFHAMGKLPGPLIKWFLEELGNEGLCRVLDIYKDRSATAAVTFALYDGRNMKLFTAETKGTIADHPRGSNDFGWTPTFIPEGYDITWGEMDDAEQEKTSMRRKAILKLEKYLEEHE